MGWTDSYLLEILEQIASRASRWGAFGRECGLGAPAVALVTNWSIGSSESSAVPHSWSQWAAFSRFVLLA